MVYNIEHFRTELQLEGVMYLDVTVDCKVPLRDTKALQKVSWYVSLPSGIACIGITRWIVERGWIECLSPRILGSMKVEGLTRNQVWPNISVKAAVKLKEIRVRSIYGSSRVSLNDALSRPAAQERV
jgi:hypothetical protein